MQTFVTYFVFFAHCWCKNWLDSLVKACVISDSAASIWLNFHRCMDVYNCTSYDSICGVRLQQCETVVSLVLCRSLLPMDRLWRLARRGRYQLLELANMPVRRHRLAQVKRNNQAHQNNARTVSVAAIGCRRFQSLFENSSRRLLLMKGSKHGLFSCRLAFKSVLHSKNAVCPDCCYYYTALLVVTDLVAWSVSLSVTLVSPAKTAEPIKMPFALRTQIGPENHVLDGVPDPPMGRGNFEGGKGTSHCRV